MGACNLEPAVPVAGASRAAVVAPSALEAIIAGVEGQGINGQMVAAVGPRSRLWLWPSFQWGL
eukprot:941939-Prymnesium_polylepis.1